MRAWWILLGTGALAACGVTLPVDGFDSTDSGGTDATVPADATADSAAPDGDVDSAAPDGDVDSGPADTGPTDSGRPDAGPPDSGPADAGRCDPADNETQARIDAIRQNCEAMTATKFQGMDTAFTYAALGYCNGSGKRVEVCIFTPKQGQTLQTVARNSAQAFCASATATANGVPRTGFLYYRTNNEGSIDPAVVRGMAVAGINNAGDRAWVFQSPANAVKAVAPDGKVSSATQPAGNSDVLPPLCAIELP